MTRLVSEPEPRATAADVKVTSDVEIDDTTVLMGLTGPRGDRLKAIERELSIECGLRGNTIFLRGRAESVALAERFFAEAAELFRQGVQIDAADVGRALRMLQSDSRVNLRDMFDDVVTLGLGRRPVGPRGLAQKRYVESIRVARPHVRHRPGGDREDVPRDGVCRGGAAGAPGEADRPHAPRGRGGGEAGLSARRSRREGEPVPSPALRRAGRHDGHRPRAGNDDARPDRSGAARVHARPHAQRLVRHPRRSAEHDERADADVPDPPRLQLARRRDRGRDAGGPPRAAERAGSPRRGSSRRTWRGSRSASSPTWTSCAIRSCRRSSSRTSSATRRRATQPRSVSGGLHRSRSRGRRSSRASLYRTRRSRRRRSNRRRARCQPPWRGRSRGTGTRGEKS